MMLSSGLTIPIERQISKASAVKSFPDTLSKGVSVPAGNSAVRDASALVWRDASGKPIYTGA